MKKIEKAEKNYRLVKPNTPIIFLKKRNPGQTKTKLVKPNTRMQKKPR